MNRYFLFSFDMEIMKKNKIISCFEAHKLIELLIMNMKHKL
jgi:hypothetical protein